MILSKELRRQKLETLREAEGFPSLDAMLEVCITDSVSPAICLACDATAEMEPDQDRGYCEACGKSRMVSALILAELI